MVKRQKYLSMYEEDLIWMSYRYCIGRHTIAANMHAGNIAKHAYGKLSPERQQFMAYDIRKSIEDNLRFSRMNVFIDTQLSRADNKEYRPLEMVLDILSEHKVEQSEDLKRLDSIYIKYDNGKLKVDYRELPSDAPDNSTEMFPILFDLYVWADLASCFDKRGHKIAIIKDEDGNEKEYEVFESYVQCGYDTYRFTKVWKPVELYVENPFICRYLPQDKIIKIKDI